MIACKSVSLKMSALKIGGVIALSGIIFTVMCLTIFRFIMFLSSVPHHIYDNSQSLVAELHNEKSMFSTTLVHTVTDLALICGFILVHSFLIQPLKIVTKKLGLSVLDRSFYNLITCITLLILMRNWKVISSFILWKIDIENNQTSWIAYVIIHSITWLIIYVGIVCMDITEFIGIRQVLYYARNLSEPQCFKSEDLRRFHSHMRHPSFTGFLIIFWIFPIMSLDRLMLAIIWSAYMLIAWKTDSKDYNYLVKQQYIKNIW